MTDNRPARPGTRSGSLLSSPSVRQVSHPQNANTEPVTPTTKAPMVNPLNGLNQSASKDRCPGAAPVPTFHSAAPAKPNNISIWNPTSAYWTRSPVVMPRHATYVATSMIASVVAIFTGLLEARSAIARWCETCAMNR
ncbi:Uncharacterised protein [Mycobacteroides abscessus subsp. abscessus]|nr:Uncharacterised protein [Mycobacteroides abscessus subsp. abscessus]